MTNITCIIADDELFSRENLKMIIEEIGASIKILGEAKNGKEAIKLINELKPQLVFLDIEMPFGDGFDVLRQVDDRNFELIFITAYEHFALKAIKESAIDYIVKPINKNDLSLAIGRAIQAIKHKISHETSYNNLLNTAINGIKSEINKIVLLVGNVYELISIDTIIRCKSDSNYTEFYLIDKRKITVSKGLKFYEELLAGSKFIRVHQSHLVNLNFIKQVEKGKYSHLTLTDGSSVEISLSRKDELFSKLGL